MPDFTQSQIKKAKELANARQFPKFYYARHMYPGLCGYDDDTILVDTDVMKKMLPTFNGKPVYVLHDERSQNERMLDIADSDGFVTETFYNEVDGWAWSKIMIVSDEGHAAIAKGWAVSNAYLPDEFGPGGTKHNCEYDRKLVDAEFTHLAIVPNPRYEDACVMTPDQFKSYQESSREQLNELRNSKSKKKGFTMKMFNRKKVEVSEINDETLVEIKNAAGKTVEVPVSEMVNALLESKAEKQNMNARIDVGGEKLSVKEVVKRYQELKNKNSDDDENQNEDDDEIENEDDENQNMDDDEVENDDDENQNDDDEVENDDDENQNDDDEVENDDDEKENEDDEKSEKSNAKKKGKKHFKELKNAHRKRAAVQNFDTPQNKLQRGKSRYGTN